VARQADPSSLARERWGEVQLRGRKFDFGPPPSCAGFSVTAARPGRGWRPPRSVGPTGRVLGDDQVKPLGELAGLRVESHGVMRPRLLLGLAGPVPDRTAGVEVSVPYWPDLTFAAGLASAAAASEARRWVGSPRRPMRKRIVRKLGIEEQ
jgi:hypothetical protein